MKWTPEMIALLKTGWRRGDTAAVISREVNMTRNAVIGKAHRLKLPGRDAPAGIKEARAKREGVRPVAAVVPSSGCPWPIGDPREPSFHFCGAARAEPGRPYCAEHRAKSIKRAGPTEGL